MLKSFYAYWQSKSIFYQLACHGFTTEFQTFLNSIWITTNKQCCCILYPLEWAWAQICPTRSICGSSRIFVSLSHRTIFLLESFPVSSSKENSHTQLHGTRRNCKRPQPKLSGPFVVRLPFLASQTYQPPSLFFLNFLFMTDNSD